MDRSYRFGELTLRDITLTLPLSNESADHRTIDVFARVVTAPGGSHHPYLLYLQGGPGHASPRPCAAPADPGWLPAALERYQVVLLDQRGTGRSTAIDERLLQELSAKEIAEYLTHMRADSIVRDAEAFRRYLGVERWSTLGQSFGGFTTLHYMTCHPESLRESYITGGLSAVNHSTEEVYTECYRRMRHNSEEFYRRFPRLRKVMHGLVERARDGLIVTPSGEIVSESRLRSIGHCLGGDDGWLSLYHLLDMDPESSQFRYDLERMLPFDGRNPLYFVIHESSYADGVTTNWSAQRCYPDDFAADPTLFTGEHVFAEWCDTVPAFRPWKEIAHIIAAHPWPRLYDAEALTAAAVPGAAAVYANDVYVPLNFSLETASYLPGLQLYITSEHEHNGLRSGKDGEVLRHLIDLVAGRRVR